jgi:hypothetical protein
VIIPDEEAELLAHSSLRLANCERNESGVELGGVGGGEGFEGDNSGAVHIEADETFVGVPLARRLRLDGLITMRE